MKTIVIKLVSSVNNDNLSYLSVFEFSVGYSLTDFSLSLGGGTVTVSTNNGTLSTTTLAPSKELTLSGYNKTVNISEDVDRVFMRGDLDKVTVIRNVIINNGLYLSYLPNLTKIVLRNFNGELKDFSDKIQYIDCRGGLRGSFADIKSTSLTNFSLYNQTGLNTVEGTVIEARKHFTKEGLQEFVLENNNNISGDIYDFAELIKLDGNTSIWFEYCPNVVGRVESLLDYLKGKKKNSKLILRLVGSKATYNGTAVTLSLTITFDEDGNFTVQ